MLERMSWRCVPSAQSISSRSPPRRTRSAVGERRPVGIEPAVPRKTTSRSTSEFRRVAARRMADRPGPSLSSDRSSSRERRSCSPGTIVVPARWFACSIFQIALRADRRRSLRGDRPERVVRLARRRRARARRRSRRARRRPRGPARRRRTGAPCRTCVRMIERTGVRVKLSSISVAWIAPPRRRARASPGTGARRRSVGEPGLRIQTPPCRDTSGRCVWP